MALDGFAAEGSPDEDSKLGDNSFTENFENNDDLSDDFRSEEDYLQQEEEEQDGDGSGDGNDDGTGSNDDFKFEDEKDEEDEDEFDFEALNKKLGTDFKTVDDLKKSLEKEETESQEQKEAEDFRINQNAVELMEKYITKSNEDLVRAQITSDFQRQKKDINDPEVIELINDKIDALRDLDEIDSKGELLRNNLKAELNNRKALVNNYQSKKEAETQKTAKENREALQGALVKFAGEESFYGVKVTPEVVKKVYNDVKSGAFFKQVEQSQESIAELALMVHYREQIKNNATRPAYSDGVKGVFDQIGSKAPRNMSQAPGGTSGKTDQDIVAAFLK